MSPVGTRAFAADLWTAIALVFVNMCGTPLTPQPCWTRHPHAQFVLLAFRRLERLLQLLRRQERQGTQVSGDAGAGQQQGVR